METPAPDEIRALRGQRSRAEFAELVGVTPLTVYRWELPPDSPELRRPRGKVLQRLQAVIAAEAAAGRSEPGGAEVGRSSAPRGLPPEVRPEDASALDPSELAVLAPVVAAIDDCQLEKAERELVRLLTSGALRSDAGRALASVSLARLQLLARHDPTSAFTTLLAVGPELHRLPGAVQLEYHLTAAFLHAHTDAQLFNPGKTHHHASLAEPLLGEGRADHRFLLGYVRLAAALGSFDSALIGRGTEQFAAVSDLASTRLNRCLAREAVASTTLTLTNVSEASRKVEEFHASALETGLPLQRLRSLIWRAELLVEEAAPPGKVLALIEQAEQLQRRHRIAPGIHAMLMTRNKGEALMRLARLGEAEEAFRDAARIGADLAYTPMRIYTSLARLYALTGRTDEARALGEECLRSEDLQKELTRTFGEILIALSDLRGGRARSGAFERLVDRLLELRRLGAWAVAYRYVATDALATVALHGSVEQGERMVQIAERALELSASPTAAAVFRTQKGVVLMRRGRLLEARQALEAAQAILEVAGNVPEAALVRRLLANVDVLAQVRGAEARLTESEAALTRLGLAAPAAIRAEPGRATPSPEPARTRAAPAEALGLERLVVPLQRLATRGVGATILQQELLNIAHELLPDRAVRLEEVDSAGAAMELGAHGGPKQSRLEWFEFRDGAGRRLRLGVTGGLEGSQRAAVQLLTSFAGIAFEVAALRGFAAQRLQSAGPSAPGVEPESAGLPELVAASPSMRRLKAELGRLSGSRATIIITGESGTGKEVVARAIHDLSRRADRPYVTFNSAAVPRELFEGQLFGYRKGAFTGATSDHPGVIRAAEGGTLFLDEIGELPLDIQPKLLRFLENGEVLPLGERKPVQVDVRIIAATHRDLLQLVREGRFREDLYYRLQVVPVLIAPLRERREDVLALARFFIRRHTPAGVAPPVLTADAEQKLVAHAWPGNVRELRNVIERSLAFDPVPALLGAEDVRL